MENRKTPSEDIQGKVLDALKDNSELTTTQLVYQKLHKENEDKVRLAIDQLVTDNKIYERKSGRGLRYSLTPFESVPRIKDQFKTNFPTGQQIALENYLRSTPLDYDWDDVEVRKWVFNEGSKLLNRLPQHNLLVPESKSFYVSALADIELRFKQRFPHGKEKFYAELPFKFMDKFIPMAVERLKEERIKGRPISSKDLGYLISNAFQMDVTTVQGIVTDSLRYL